MHSFDSELTAVCFSDQTCESEKLFLTLPQFWIRSFNTEYTVSITSQSLDSIIQYHTMRLGALRAN